MHNKHAAAIATAIAITCAAACSEDAQREAKRWGAEQVGEIAARAVNAPEGERAAGWINTPVTAREIAPGIFQASGVANSYRIATPAGDVIFDTGLAVQAAKQQRLLQEAAAAAAGAETKVTHVLLSHSHQDHVGGAAFYQGEGVALIAHAQFPEEQRYLKELEPYFWHRNRTLFPWMPEAPPQSGFMAFGHTTPTQLVADGAPLRFAQGGVQFEALPMPGAEGADNLVLWLPQRKILFSGDVFGPLFPQFPNVFTMRGEKVRKPAEYIASLERMIALQPELILPGHNEAIAGAEAIRAALQKMRDAVEYVHDATVAGMNAGKTVHQLMAEIQLPPELALSEGHGRVSWAVKSIWEYYATWFHFDRTTELYALPQSAVHAELAALAGAAELTRAAQAHLKAQRPLHALYLIEVALADAAGDGDGAQRRAALAARLAALRQLQTRAGPRGNAYELDWLKYRIRATEAALQP